MPLLDAQLARILKSRGTSLHSVPTPFASPSRDIVYPSLLRSNEGVSEHFFERIANNNREAGKAADGYLVGVGVANALSAMHLFEGRMPTAVVLFDVDPEVILIGKALVNAFTRHERFEGLQAELTDPGRLEALLRAVVRQEAHPRLRAAFQGIALHSLMTYISSGGMRVLAGQDDAHGDGRPFSANKYLKRALETYYQQFRRLALEGKFGVFLADVADERFIGAIAQLRGFRSSNNVVYLSNAVDVLVAYSPNKDAMTNALEHLEPDDAHRNTYLDTLWTNRYVLLARYDVPRFAIGSQDQWRALRSGATDERGALVRQETAQLGRPYGPFFPHEVVQVPIGSSLETSGLVINDAEVSPSHVVIAYDAAAGWYVRNEGAAEETRVENRLVRGHTAERLQHGDRICLGGDTVLRVVIDEGFLTLIPTRLAGRGEPYTSEEAGRRVVSLLLQRLTSS